MKAKVGDGLTVKGLHQGDEDRHGTIIEVHGENGSPPFLVRWADSHQSVFFPSTGTVLEHRPAAGRARAGDRRAQAGTTP